MRVASRWRAFGGQCFDYEAAVGFKWKYRQDVPEVNNIAWKNDLQK